MSIQSNRVYVPGNKPPVIGRCESCLYWRAIPMHDGSVMQGSCRRHPPSLVVTKIDGFAPEVETHFPITGTEDGCGEFASRSQSQAQVGDQTSKRSRMSDG